MIETTSAATCEEVENVLLLLVQDVRRYRDSEQKQLSDTTKGINELYRLMGAVAALKTVERVVCMVGELYGVDLGGLDV